MSTKPSVAMTPEELVSFVRGAKLAVVCAVGQDGKLVARVARCRSEDGEVLKLDLSGPAGDLPQGSACALIDTYPSYREIKGAMLRGPLQIEGMAGRLQPDRASGFDFSKAPAAA